MGVARAALCPLLSWAHVLFTVGLLDRARLPLKGVRPITPYSWYRVQSETQKRGPYHGVLVRARGKKLNLLPVSAAAVGATAAARVRGSSRSVGGRLAA